MDFIEQFNQCNTMAEGKIFVEVFLEYITNVKIPLNQKRLVIQDLLAFSEDYYQNINSESKLFLNISDNYIQYIIVAHLLLGIDQNMTYLKGLCEILIDLCGGYKVSTGNSINKTEVEYLLNTEKGKNLCKIVSKQKPLVILNILEKHFEFNSITLTYFNLIINSVHKLENQDRVYVFAHELGHILQYSKTNSQEIYPSGFYDMFERAFNNKISNVRGEDLTEIFADCFSVYFMIGSKYEHNNPFIQEFSDESIYIINEFFENLMNLKRRERLINRLESKILSWQKFECVYFKVI